MADGSTRGGAVLLIDDDPVARRHFRHVLQERGYEVVTAVDGEAGLSLARIGRPALVLLDLEMPGRHGLEVLAELRDGGWVGEAPVLVLTSDARPERLQAALALGAHDFVAKADPVEVFLARVDAAVRFGTMVRELSDANERLRRLAATDELTGLLNRRAINAALRKAHAAAERGMRGFGVVLLDLDGFKQVNDRRGHVDGDRALVAVAGALRAVSRLQDDLGRWGGDEFLCIVDGATDGEVEAAALRLKATVDEVDEAVTASVGAVAWRPGEPVEALLARADSELYAEKRRRAAA